MSQQSEIAMRASKLIESRFPESAYGPLFVPARRQILALMLDFCADARKEIERMDTALLLATEIAAALKPLIPRYESTSGETRERWQKVVNAIHAAADFAGTFPTEIQRRN
jgi:hypothetical protein